MEGNSAAPTAEQFRRACGRFATGVAVATTVDEAGIPHGLTINSFTSVSLDPLLVLFCVDRAAQALAVFEGSNSFVINILDQSQRDISRQFATRQEDRFDGLLWRRGVSGAPVLNQSLAILECRRHSVLDGGDHRIFLGEVIAVEAGDGDPLLYFAGRYRQLAE